MGRVQVSHDNSRHVRERCLWSSGLRPDQHKHVNNRQGIRAIRNPLSLPPTDRRGLRRSVVGGRQSYKLDRTERVRVELCSTAFIVALTPRTIPLTSPSPSPP